MCSASVSVLLRVYGTHHLYSTKGQNDAGEGRRRWTCCESCFTNSVTNFREEVDYNLNKVEIEVEMEGGLVGGRRESSSTRVIIIIEWSNSVFTPLPH